MSTETMNLVGTEQKVFGTVSFDDRAHCWHIASAPEPNFQHTFATQQDAFYFWYSRFDPTTGKLRP
jgi:hypothetical protein